MWTGTGPRERRVPVRFSAAFAAPPAVHVSLSMLDLERRHNHRIDISAATITSSDFQIVFKTWGDTRIARARASWMAVGELADEDVWDV